MHVVVDLDLPADLEEFKLPPGVNHRLQDLLDRQDQGEQLTDSELKEAEGLVDLAELLSLLKMRAQRLGSSSEPPFDPGDPPGRSGGWLTPLAIKN
jgi:hypothetical protein